MIKYANYIKKLKIERLKNIEKIQKLEQILKQCTNIDTKKFNTNLQSTENQHISNSSEKIVDQKTTDNLKTQDPIEKMQTLKLPYKILDISNKSSGQNQPNKIQKSKEQKTNKKDQNKKTQKSKSLEDKKIIISSKQRISNKSSEKDPSNKILGSTQKYLSKSSEQKPPKKSPVQKPPKKSPVQKPTNKLQEQKKASNQNQNSSNLTIEPNIENIYQSIRANRDEESAYSLLNDTDTCNKIRKNRERGLPDGMPSSVSHYYSSYSLYDSDYSKSAYRHRVKKRADDVSTRSFITYSDSDYNSIMNTSSFLNDLFVNKPIWTKKVDSEVQLSRSFSYSSIPSGNGDISVLSLSDIEYNSAEESQTEDYIVPIAPKNHVSNGPLKRKHFKGRSILANFYNKPKKKH